MCGLENAQEIELPILFIAKKNSIFFTITYGLSIILAMLTSAVSAGFGFIENISGSKKTQKFILIGLCVISVLASNMGFSNLLRTLYPFFGFLGIVQMFFILHLEK